MTATSTRSLSRRLVGVVASKRTYRNLGYLFVRFPLGLAYFTLFVTGITLGVALVPLLVGVPLLIGVLVAADYAGCAEARIASGLLGVDAAWEPIDPTELSVIEYAKTVVTSPRHYALVVYFLAQFVVGTVAFIVLTIGLVIPLSLLVAPLVYWLPEVQYQLLGGDGSMITIGSWGVDTAVGTGEFDMAVIDTLPEAMIVSVVGAIALLIALHVLNAVARGLGWAAVGIFDPVNQN